MSYYQIRNLDLIVEKISEVCNDYTSDQFNREQIVEFLTKILIKEQESMVTSERQYRKFYRKIIETYIPK